MTSKRILIPALSIMCIIAIIGFSFSIQKEKTEFTVVEEKAYANQTIDKTNLESINSITNVKQNILIGMLNSIDYYSTVEGTFVTSFIEEGKETTVTYKTDLINQCSYQKINNESVNFDQYVQSNIGITYNNNTNDALEYKVLPCSETKITMTDSSLILYSNNSKEDTRITVNSDGTKKYTYRQDMTNTGIATMSIFSQEMTFGFLGNTDLWEVIGTTEILGRTCVVISGETEEEYGEKLNVNQFVMYVDINSGIIINFEGYSSTNELTQYIETKEININGTNSSESIKSFVATSIEENYNNYSITTK